MNCQVCQRQLAPDEPAYRVQTTSNYKHWPGSLTGTVCAECELKEFSKWRRTWRDPIPCMGCGRPVFNELRPLRTNRIICGYGCRGSAYNAQARAWRARLRKPKPCPVCGENIHAQAHRQPLLFKCLPTESLSKENRPRLLLKCVCSLDGFMNSRAYFA